MATYDDRSEKQLENNSTNGESNVTLQYSGASEDNLNVSESNNVVGGKMNADFGDDLVDHDMNMSPAPLAKAVKKNDIQDNQGLSDDDLPKTLTTLETVKKTIETNQSDEIEICPIETTEDDEEEEPVLLEVYHEDGEDEIIPSENIDGDTFKANKKQNVAIASHNGKKKNKSLKLNSAKNRNDLVNQITPIKPIPAQSAGTIEIPRELINSSDIDTTPVIINRIKNTTGNNDDLIAILEGGDNNGSLNVTTSVEHYELSLPNENGDKITLSREEEREIAMEQMLNLPKKKKGRPKLNVNAKAPKTPNNKKSNKNDELVHSLVSDWDENEAKNNDTNEPETEIVVEINIPPQKKRKIVEPIQPTFRRSRIIKKKIIWDPDAPETAINYASLVHTSGEQDTFYNNINRVILMNCNIGNTILCFR